MFYEYFILASNDFVPISLSILLPNRRLRVCTPPHLLHPCPFPSLTTSHLLDLIEFFPEEEMFPPNESVEILHSDKHDPIFRLIKESISLPCLRRKLSVLVGRSFLSLSPPLFPFHEIFDYVFFFFQKRFPRKHSIFSYVLYPRDELILKSYGARSIFTNGKLFKLINFDILLAEYIFTI